MNNFSDRKIKYPIDFVVSWVDEKDPLWQSRMEETLRNACVDSERRFDKDFADERYRDWKLLKYWFRGVEKFAPWVRRVWLVTDAQVPDFINLGYKKLNIVDHKDYIPAKYLPTFNSNVIELNFHRIEGLSEHFVYFNDDMLLTSPVKRSDFFRNGVPADMLCFQPDVANETDDIMPYIFLNNAMVLARHFDKRAAVFQNPGNYFSLRYPFKNIVYNAMELCFPRYTGFFTPHGPSPFMKSAFYKLWQIEGEAFDKSCESKFRSRNDINQYLIREYQKLSGDFTPYNTAENLAYCDLSDDNERICRIISGQKKKMVCLNDSANISDFEGARAQLCSAFETILPEKSRFEK